MDNEAEINIKLNTQLEINNNESVRKSNTISMEPEPEEDTFNISLNECLLEYTQPSTLKMLSENVLARKLKTRYSKQVSIKGRTNKGVAEINVKPKTRTFKRPLIVTRPNGKKLSYHLLFCMTIYNNPLHAG